MLLCVCFNLRLQARVRQVQPGLSAWGGRGDAKKTGLKKRLAQLEFWIGSMLLVMYKMHLLLVEDTALGSWSLQAVDLNSEAENVFLEATQVGKVV